MYEITVEHEFSAAHAIRLGDGRMEASHEHLWKMAATFRADRLDDATGVVIDFLDVRRAMASIAAELAGRDLNQALGLEDGASAERVARCLARLLQGRLGAEGDKLFRLAVTEAPGCSAAFYPPPALS